MVITRPNWNGLLTDMKLELFENFNIMIPKDLNNTVQGSMQDWSNVDALEQHVPLHTQHCVHGESNECIIHSETDHFVHRSTLQVSRRQQHRCSLNEFAEIICKNQAGKSPQRVLNMLDIPLSACETQTMGVLPVYLCIY